MASKEEQEQVIIDAMKRMVTSVTNGAITYKARLVPSAPLSKDGLERTWQGWHLALRKMLDSLHDEGLPYSELVLDVRLVEETYSRTLHTLRNRLIEQLDLIDEHKVGSDEQDQ